MKKCGIGIVVVQKKKYNKGRNAQTTKTTRNVPIGHGCSRTSNCFFSKWTDIDIVTTEQTDKVKSYLTY